MHKEAPDSTSPTPEKKPTDGTDKKRGADNEKSAPLNAAEKQSTTSLVSSGDSDTVTIVMPTILPVSYTHLTLPTIYSV